MKSKLVNNPAVTPLVVLTVGVLWNISIVVIANYLSGAKQMPPEYTFWMKQAGWAGFATTVAFSAILFLLSIVD